MNLECSICGKCNQKNYELKCMHITCFRCLRAIADETGRTLAMVGCKKCNKISFFRRDLVFPSEGGCDFTNEMTTRLCNDIKPVSNRIGVIEIVLSQEEILVEATNSISSEIQNNSLKKMLSESPILNLGSKLTKIPEELEESMMSEYIEPIDHRDPITSIPDTINRQVFLEMKMPLSNYFSVTSYNSVVEAEDIKSQFCDLALKSKADSICYFLTSNKVTKDKRSRQQKAIEDLCSSQDKRLRFNKRQSTFQNRQSPSKLSMIAKTSRPLRRYASELKNVLLSRKIEGLTSSAAPVRKVKMRRVSDDKSHSETLISNNINGSLRNSMLLIISAQSSKKRMSTDPRRVSTREPVHIPQTYYKNKVGFLTTRSGCKNQTSTGISSSSNRKTNDSLRLKQVKESIEKKLRDIGINDSNKPELWRRALFIPKNADASQLIIRKQLQTKIKNARSLMKVGFTSKV